MKSLRVVWLHFPIAVAMLTRIAAYDHFLKNPGVPGMTISYIVLVVVDLCDSFLQAFFSFCDASAATFDPQSMRKAWLKCYW